MNFEVTVYLLITYSAFVKYLNKWKYNDAVHQLFFGFKRAYDSVMGEVLLNSVIECVFNLKLLILTKIGLNESCKIIWVDKHTVVVFPIRNGMKNGDVLLPLVFKFALEHVFRTFAVKQDD